MVDIIKTLVYLDVLGPGCGPHEHLSVWADLAEDLPDLGLEPHVQHPVCLVQDYVRTTTEVCLTHLKNELIYLSS